MAEMTDRINRLVRMLTADEELRTELKERLLKLWKEQNLPYEELRREAIRIADSVVA